MSYHVQGMVRKNLQNYPHLKCKALGQSGFPIIRGGQAQVWLQEVRKQSSCYNSDLKSEWNYEQGW